MAIVGPFPKNDPQVAADALGLWELVARALRDAGVSFDLDQEGGWAGYVMREAIGAAAIPFVARTARKTDSARTVEERREHAAKQAASLRAAADLMEMRSDWELDPDSLGFELSLTMSRGITDTLREAVNESDDHRRRWGAVGAPALFKLSSTLARRLPQFLRAAADAAEAWGKLKPKAPQPTRAGARRIYLLRYLWERFALDSDPGPLTPIADELAWRLASLLAPSADGGQALGDAKKMIRQWKNSARRS